MYMLSIYKLFLLLNSFILPSKCFIVRRNTIIPTRNLRNNLICMNLNPHNTTLNTINPKKSKIYKIIFRNIYDDDYEDEYNELFKPKYILGLSDYQLVFIRMYIYLVIIYYCISQILKK